MWPWKRRPLFGSVKPTASNRANRPLASPRPSNSPTIEATSPIDESLDRDGDHDLLTRGAERPERRELARPLRDRDRERVGDHEGSDEERDPTEDEQERAQERDERVGIRGVFLRLRIPVRTCVPVGEDLLDLGDERVR